MTANEENWQPQVVVHKNNDGDDLSASDSKLALSQPLPFWRRAMVWYVSPLWWDAKTSGKSVLYQILNYCLAWTCAIYSAVTYSVAGAFLIFIVGIPLLWFVLEMAILLARLDIALAYYVMERELQTPVKLALHVRHLPLCIWSAPIASFWGRFKFIITSCPTYMMMIYQLVVKLVVASIFSLSMLPLMSLLWGMGVPFWYASNPKFFRESQVCLFGETGNPKKVDSCHPYQIHVSNFGDAFGVFLLCWAIFPLALRLNTFCADVQKIVTYYFLTDHYRPEQEKSDQVSLISRQQPAAGKPTKRGDMSNLDENEKQGRDSDDDLL